MNTTIDSNRKSYRLGTFGGLFTPLEFCRVRTCLRWDRASDRCRFSHEPDDFTEVLHRHSKDASPALLGFNVPEISVCRECQRRFDLMLDGMPTTLLVYSSGEADVMA